MSFKYLTKIISEHDIKEKIPLSKSLKDIKDKRDEEIKSVFESKNNKFLLIIGPCSADNEKAVYEYVTKLSKVQEKVNEKIILIPRIYTNKPRTTGIGYKGMLHQPDPNKNPDISEGIIAIRNLHIKVIEESNLTSADEMLYPQNYPYLDDILSYVAVGARSVENQYHRLTASGIDCPVGMKNPSSGDLDVMFNSIKAAQVEHNFIFKDYSVLTTGNPYAHAILRGYVTNEGEHRPNYHYEDLIKACEFYKKSNLKNPAIIIDTNHSNSGKKYKEQIRIANEILYSRSYNKDLRNIVKGLMIESYLEEGSQKIGENIYGKSITDPCLGWNDSEKLILDIAEKL